MSLSYYLTTWSHLSRFVPTRSPRRHLKRRTDKRENLTPCSERTAREKGYPERRLTAGVINQSSQTITETQKLVLAKGLNFAPAPRKIPVQQIVSTIETGLRRITSKVAADDARLKISSLLMKARAPPTNLTPEERRALKELRRSNDLMILPADKGRATVLLDRTNYEKKLQDMLDDTSTYRKLTNDPTPSLERRMNSILLKLHKDDQLPTQLYRRLHSSASHCPPYNCLPKVHN